MAKYLDSAGLTYLWNKIKTLVSTAVSTVGNYTVNGKKLSTNPVLTKADVGLGNVDNTSDADKPVSTAMQTELDKKLNTSQRGAANGVASLGSDGKLPTAQLPTLKTINGTSVVGSGDIKIDLSLYKVVSALPTTDIDANKVYLVLSGTQGTQNKYTEYVYVNNAWEKLGEYQATVDLSPYVKFTDLATAAKAGAMSPTDYQMVAVLKSDSGSLLRAVRSVQNSDSDYVSLVFDYSTGWGDDHDSGENEVMIKPATETTPGVMSAEDKVTVDKLQGFSLLANKGLSCNQTNKDFVDLIFYSVDTNSSDTGRDGEGYIKIDAATAEQAGVMSADDKSKLDGVTAGATADVALTTAELDEILV